MTPNKKDILEYLTGLRDFLTELLSVVKSIVNLIWNNKFIVLVLFLIYLCYLALNYIAFEMPKRTVVKYYSLVDSKELSKAWNMLTPQCQVRWKNGEIDFKDGYATLATTKILSIDNFNPGEFLDAITSDKKQLLVDLIVVENFRGLNLVDSLGKDKPTQGENTFWLSLKHKDAIVNRLKTDSLSNYRSALKLVRRYRKVFTIQKNPNADFLDRLSSNNWVITDVDNKEVGIIFDTTFYYK